MGVDVLKKYSIEIGIINNAAKELDAMEKEINAIAKDGKLVSSLNDEFKKVKETITGLQGEIAALGIKIGDNAQLDAMSQKFQTTADQISTSVTEISGKMVELEKAITAITSGDALGISDAVRKQFESINTTISEFASKYESALQLINAAQEKGVNFDVLANAIRNGKKDVISALEDDRKEIEKELQRIADAGINIFDQTSLSDLEFLNATQLQASLNVIQEITNKLKKAGVKMSDVNGMLMDIKIGGRSGLNLDYLQDVRKQIKEIIEYETGVAKSVSSASEKINEVRFRYILDENGKGAQSVIDKIKAIIEKVQRAVNKDFIKIKIGYEYDDSEDEKKNSDATTTEAKEKEIIKKLIVKTEIKRDQVLDQVNKIVKDINKELSKADAPKIKIQVEADLKEGKYSEIADDVSNELKDRGANIDRSTGRITTGEIKINDSGLATEDTLKAVLQAIRDCCAQGGAPGGNNKEAIVTPEISEEAKRSASEELDRFLVESIFRLRRSGKYLSKEETGILKTREMLLGRLFTGQQEKGQLAQVIKAAKKGDLEALRQTDYYKGSVKVNGVEYAKYGKNGETLADWQKTVEEQFLRLSKAYTEAAQKAKDDFVKSQEQTAEDYLKTIYDSKIEEAKRLADEAVESYKEEQKIKGKTPTEQDIERERKRIYEQLEKEADQERQYKRSIYNRSDKPVKGWQAEIIDTFIELQKRLDKNDSAVRKNFEDRYRGEITELSKSTGDEFHVAASKLVSQKINEMIERVINSATPKDFTDTFTPTVIQNRTDKTGEQILASLQSKAMEKAALPAIGEYTKELKGIMLQLKGTMERLAANGAEVKVEKGQARVLARQSTAVNVWEGQSEAQLQFNEINETAIERYRERQEILEALKEGEASLIEYKDLMAKKESGLSEEEEQRLKALEKELLTSAEVVNNKERQLQLQKEYAEITERLSRGKEAFHGSQKEYDEGVTRAQDIIREMSENIRPAQNSDELLEFVNSELNRIKRLESEQRGLIATTKETIRTIANNYGANEWRKEDEEELNELVSSVTSLLETITDKNGIADRSLLTSQESRKLRSAEDRIRELRNKQSAYLALQASESDESFRDIITGKSISKTSGAASSTTAPRITNLGLDNAMSVAYAQAEESIKNVTSLTEEDLKKLREIYINALDQMQKDISDDDKRALRTGGEISPELKAKLNNMAKEILDSYIKNLQKELDEKIKTHAELQARVDKATTPEEKEAAQRFADSYKRIQIDPRQLTVNQLTSETERISNSRVQGIIDRAKKQKEIQEEIYKLLSEAGYNDEDIKEAQELMRLIQEREAASSRLKDTQILAYQFFSDKDKYLQFDEEGNLYLSEMTSEEKESEEKRKKLREDSIRYVQGEFDYVQELFEQADDALSKSIKEKEGSPVSPAMSQMLFKLMRGKEERTLGGKSNLLDVIEPKANEIMGILNEFDIDASKMSVARLDRSSQILTDMAQKIQIEERQAIATNDGSAESEAKIKELHNSWVALADAARKIEDLNPLENLFEVWVRERKTVDRLRSATYAESSGHAFGLDEEQESRLFDLTEQLKPTYRGRSANTFSLTTVSAISKLQELRKKVKEYPENNKYKTNLENQIKELEDQLAKSGFFVDESGNVEARGARQSRLDAILDRLINNYVLRANQDDFITKRIQTIDQEIARREEISHREANEAAVDTIIGSLFGTGEEPVAKETKEQKEAEIKAHYDSMMQKQDDVISEAEKVIEEEKKKIEKARGEIKETISPEMESLQGYINQLIQNDPEYSRLQNIERVFREGNLPNDFAMTQILDKKMKKIADRIVKEHEEEIEALKQRNRQRREDHENIEKTNKENQARQAEIEAAEARITTAQEEIKNAQEEKKEIEEKRKLAIYPFGRAITSKMTDEEKKAVINYHYDPILNEYDTRRKEISKQLKERHLKELEIKGAEAPYLKKIKESGTKSLTQIENEELHRLMAEFDEYHAETVELENAEKKLSEMISFIKNIIDTVLGDAKAINEKTIQVIRNGAIVWANEAKEAVEESKLAEKNTEEAKKARLEQAEAERKANEEHAQLVEKIDQERRNEAMRSHNGISGKIANPYDTETNKHRKAIESLWRTAGMTEEQAGIAREIAQIIKKLKDAKGQIKTDLEAELKERQEYAKTLNLQINSHGYVQELVSYREYMENPFKWIKPEQVEAVMNRTRGSGKSSTLDTEVTGLATESTLRKVLNAIENCCKNGGMGKRPKLKWGGIDTGVDGIRSYDKNLKKQANDLLKLDQGMVNKETQEAIRKAIISGFGINRSKKDGILYMGGKGKKSNYDKAETEKFIKEHNLKESIDKATAAIKANVEQQKSNSGYNNYSRGYRRRGGQPNNRGGNVRGKNVGIDGITAYDNNLFSNAKTLLSSDPKAANKATKDAIRKALISGYGLKTNKNGDISVSALKWADKAYTDKYIKDNGLTDEVRKARQAIEGYRKDKKDDGKKSDSASDSSTNTRRRRKAKTKSNRSGISEEDIYSFEETYRTTDEKYKIDWKALGQLKGELNDVLKNETATPQQMEEAVKKGVEAGLIVSKDDETGNRILRSPALLYRRKNGSFGGSVTPAEIQATRDYATANGIALTKGIAADTGYTIGMKAVNIEAPKADVKAADAKVETPKTEVETPSADVKTSEAKIETPSVNVEGKSLAQLNNIIARTKDENKRKAWIDSGADYGYMFDSDTQQFRLYTEEELEVRKQVLQVLKERLSDESRLAKMTDVQIARDRQMVENLERQIPNAEKRIAEASGTTEVHPATSAPEHTPEVTERKAKADEHAAVATESLATAEEHLAKTAESATEAVKTEASSKKKSNGKEFTRADFEAMDDETLQRYYRTGYRGINGKKSKWGTDTKTKWTGYLTEIEDIFKTRGIEPLDALKKASDKAAKEVAELGDSADKAETKVKETTTPSSASDKPVSDTAPKSSGKGKSSGAYSGYALESTLQKVLAAIQECCKKGGMSGSGKNKSGSDGKGKTTAKTDPTVGNPYTTQETDVLIKKYAETLKKIGEAAYVEEADKLKKTLDALEQAILSKKDNLSDTDAFTNERLLSFWNMLNKPYNSGVIAKGTGLGQVYQNVVDELVNNRGFKLGKDNILRRSIFDALGVSERASTHLIGERDKETGRFILNDFGEAIKNKAGEVFDEFDASTDQFELSVKTLVNGISQYTFKTLKGNAVLEYNERTGQFSRGAGSNITNANTKRQQDILREYSRYAERFEGMFGESVIKTDASKSYFNSKFNVDVDDIRQKMNFLNGLINDPSGLSSHKYEELRDVLEELKKKYREIGIELKNAESQSVGFLDLNKGSTRSQLEKMAYDLSNGRVEIQKFNEKNQELVYTMRTADNMVKTFTLSVNKQTGEITKSMVSEQKYVNGLTKFIDSLYGKGAELFRYVIANFSIYRVFGEIRQGLNVIREMDTAMTNLNKVSNDSAASLEKFRKESYNIASSIGSTGKAVVDAATEWARLGYSIKEAAELAKASSVYANVGEIDSATATTDLVSVLKAFNIDSDNVMNVVDVLNEIGNNYAVSSAQLGEILEKSSSALAVSGDSMEQVVAMGAAMNEVVQDASVTGSTLKILSLRLRGTKTDIEEAGEETDGMAESTSKLREKILALTNVTGKGGFDIMADENTYKSTYEIVKGIAQVWNDMSQIDQSALLELIAGKNRAQGVSALISNFAKSEEALSDALNASGSALRENDKYMESINGHIAVMQNKYQQLWDNAINRDFVNFIIDVGTGVLDLVNNVGLLKTIMVGIIPLITTFNGAIGKMPAMFDAKNFGLGENGRTTLSFFGNPIYSGSYIDTIDKFGQNIQSRAGSGDWAKIVDEEAEKLGIVNTELKDYAKAHEGILITGSEYIANLKKQGKSLDGLTASTVAANVATKALSIVMNMAISALIGMAISLAVDAIDKYVRRVEIAQQELEEVISASDNSKKELEGINEQLKEIDKNIKLIETKDKLTLTDKNELEKLKEQNDELERQATILEANAKLNGREALRKARELYNTDVTTHEYDQSKDRVVNMRYGTPAEDMHNRMNEYEIWLDKLEEARQKQLDADKAYKNNTDREREEELREIKDSADKEVEINENKLLELENSLRDSYSNISNIRNGYNQAQSVGIELTEEEQSELEVLNGVENRYVDLLKKRNDGTTSVINADNKAIQSTAKTSEEMSQLSESVQNVISKYSELATLLNSESLNESVNLSDEQLKRYGDALEYVNGKLVLNAELARKIELDNINKQIEENTQSMRDEMRQYSENERKIQQYTLALGNNNEVLIDGQTINKSTIQSLKDHNELIIKNYKAYQYYNQRLRETTGTYQEWLAVQSQSTVGTALNDAQTAIDTIKEAIETGYTGTEKYAVALDFLVPDNVDKDDISAVTKYGKKISKYFTEGGVGVNNFVQDAMTHTLEDGTHLIEKLDDGTYKLSGSVQDFAKEMELTSDVVRIFWQDLIDRGWKFEWNDDGITDFTEKLFELRSEIDKTKSALGDNKESEIDKLTDLLLGKSKQLNNGILSGDGDSQEQIENTLAIYRKAIDEISALSNTSDPDKIIEVMNALTQSGVITSDDAKALLEYADALKKANEEYRTAINQQNTEIYSNYSEHKQEIDDLLEAYNGLKKDGLETSVALSELSEKYGIELDITDAESSINTLRDKIEELTGTDQIIDIYANIEARKNELEAMKKGNEGDEGYLEYLNEQINGADPLIKFYEDLYGKINDVKEKMDELDEPKVVDVDIKLNGVDEVENKLDELTQDRTIEITTNYNNGKQEPTNKQKLPEEGWTGIISEDIARIIQNKIPKQYNVSGSELHQNDDAYIDSVMESTSANKNNAESVDNNTTANKKLSHETTVLNTKFSTVSNNSLPRLITGIDLFTNKVNNLELKIPSVVTSGGGNGAQYVSRKARAKGTDREATPTTALVGELGRELVVDPHKGTWYTVGDNGSEFVDLPKDAIVYPHDKTEQLLKRGFIFGRGMMTGKSFASGNSDYTELYRFGNVDLRNRQKFWWDENTPSTVLGTQLESNGLQFAVSPLLQGDDGNPILLEPETINWYVDELTSKSLVPNEILKLDHLGINDNGFWIHDLVAYVGNSLDTALYISKVMHEISDRYERATGGYDKGKSYANGKNNDLVGELGAELVVDTQNGTWRLVGQNGTEFTDIKPTDIVYNAEETKKILGNSYLNGKAFNPIDNRVSSIGNAIVITKTSDGDSHTTHGWSQKDAKNADNVAKSTKDIEKSTEETAENIGEIKNSIEWVDRAISSIEMTNNRIKEEAEDENNSYAERLSMYKSLLASDEDMIAVQEKALKIRESEWDRWTGLMKDTFGTEQADEFIDKIKTGNATLEEWRDSLNDIAPDDETAAKWLQLINDAIGAYDALEQSVDDLDDAQDRRHENLMAQFELELNMIDSVINGIQNEIDIINDRIDYKNTIGALVTEDDYRSLISGTDNIIDEYSRKLETLQRELKELEPESSAYNEVEEQIYQIESSIRQCEKQQAEWNEEILDIPIKRIESYLSVLKNIQSDLSNEQSREGYLSDEEITKNNLDMYKNAREQFASYVEEHEKLQEKLQRYDYGSDKFEETQSKIQECEDSMSGLINDMRGYSDAILRIPLNKLEKLNTVLSSIKESVDETNSEWELATNTVVTTIDRQVDSINELIKAKEEEAEAAIKPLQEQLDLMEKQNAERQRQLQLEQAQFNLAKAQQEKTIQVNG